jgi:hypothetical protein
MMKRLFRIKREINLLKKVIKVVNLRMRKQR